MSTRIPEIYLSSKKERDTAVQSFRQHKSHGGRLPTRLRINGSTPYDLKLEDVAAFIEMMAPDHWEEIEFDNVTLFSGFMNASSLIGAALANCDGLTKLTFTARGDIPSMHLIEWGKLISQAPQLEEFVLNYAHPEAIEQILLPVMAKHKSYLRCIHAVVPHCSKQSLLERTSFQAFIHACMQCATLREIALHSSRKAGDFAPDQVELVAQLIRQSNLRKLSFRVGRRSTSLKSWALALENNETLQELLVRSYGEPVPVAVKFMEEVSAFRNALFKNTTLKRLVVQDWTTDRWDLDALYNPFKLAQKKGLPEESTKDLAAVYFCLRLNNTGRDKILAWKEAVPACKTWLVATVANEDDLSVVYYYLRHNPSVLNLCGPNLVLGASKKRDGVSIAMDTSSCSSQKKKSRSNRVMA